MKYLITILISYFIINTYSYSQNFNNPESVAYDKLNDRFIVSNKGGDNLAQIDKYWKVTNYYENCNAPKGLHIDNNRLYVATNEAVLVFNLETDLLVKTIEVQGATFLNDIITDKNGFLYVSGMRQNKIHRIDLKTNEYSLFIDTEQNSPNGLFYDEENESIYIGYRSGGDRTFAIYNMDGEELKVKKLDHSIDGIACSKDGYLFFSNWNPAGVYRISFDLEGEIETVSSDHEGPADFKIIQKNGRQILVVPNFLRNTVDFIYLDDNNITELFKTVE